MGKRGPKRLPLATLKARGSKLVKQREAAALKPKRKPRVKPAPKRKPISDSELQSLLGLLPGFDPFANNAGAWFEPKLARKAIEFIETKLVHIEGSMAGKPLLLQPWQKSIVANLFGWVQLDDEGRTVRRFRESLIYISRKNGKTVLCSALALFALFEDNEAAPRLCRPPQLATRPV